MVTVVDRLPDHIVSAASGPVDPGAAGDMAAARDSELRRLSDQAKQMALEAGVQLHVEVVAGRVVDSIVQAVRRQDCDLLIFGLGQRPGLLSMLLAHTCYDLAESAPCSVLGVH